MEGYSDFEALLAESLPMIRAIASSFPERHREDLIQDGILGLHNAYVSFDPSIGVPFKTYARICVNNSILTAYKKLKRNDSSDVFDEELFADESASMEESVINKNDASAFFIKLREALSPLERNILTEYLRDKTYEEISEVLSVSVKTVDNALMRIKKKMRKLY